MSCNDDDGDGGSGRGSTSNNNGHRNCYNCIYTGASYVHFYFILVVHQINVAIRWTVVGICVFAQHHHHGFENDSVAIVSHFCLYLFMYSRFVSVCVCRVGKQPSRQPNEHDHKYVFYQHIFDVCLYI